jgi:hypothetical protein
MSDRNARPAFYAAGPGGWRDWWTLLHPPYTAWHLSYVLIGASLGDRIDGRVLAATLFAFFLAVGISAHALDELNGRPLNTQIGSITLKTAATLGLTGAVSIGALGVARLGLVFIPFVIVGLFLAISYNLELFRGVLHTDFMFAAAWGAFPVITSAFAQTGTITLAAVITAAGAFALASAQRTLSTPARFMRRKVDRFDATIHMADGTTRPLSSRDLITPLEGALRALSWSVLLFALGLVASKV